MPALTWALWVWREGGRLCRGHISAAARPPIFSELFKGYSLWQIRPHAAVHMSLCWVKWSQALIWRFEARPCNRAEVAGESTLFSGRGSLAALYCIISVFNVINLSLHKLLNSLFESVRHTHPVYVIGSYKHQVARQSLWSPLCYKQEAHTETQSSL